MKQKGYTIVPVKLYFNARGIAKVTIALAKGKAEYDKRQTIRNAIGIVINPAFSAAKIEPSQRVRLCAKTFL